MVRKQKVDMIKNDLSGNGRPVRLCIMTTVPITVVFFYEKQFDFLKEKGFDVTVITSPDNMLDKQISKSCRLILIPMVRGISFFRDMISLCKVFHEIRKGQFDIIQYCTPKAAMLGSIAAFVLRVPVRLYLMWGLYYTGQKGVKRLLMKSAEKAICALSTHISPDSKSNCDFAVEEKLCPASKISVVGEGSASGIDLEKFNVEKLRPAGIEIRKRYDIPEKAFVIGFVGRLRSDKGIHELVLAFKQLFSRHPDIYLLLVGPWEADLSKIGEEEENFIRSHDKNVIYVGYQEKVEEFMAAMDVFVLPSYREGFGMVNIEASAMGLPVVSTSINGVKDSVIADTTGFLVPVRSAEALVEKIEMLVNDEKLRKDMGSAGKKWAVKFEQKSHWEKIFLHRLNLLEKTGNYHYDRGSKNITACRG